MSTNETVLLVDDCELDDDYYGEEPEQVDPPAAADDPNEERTKAADLDDLAVAGEGDDADAADMAQDDYDAELNLGDPAMIGELTHAGQLQAEYAYVFGPSSNFEYYQATDPMADVDLTNILSPHERYSKLETLRASGPDYNSAAVMSDDSDGCSTVMSSMDRDQDEQLDEDLGIAPPSERVQRAADAEEAEQQQQQRAGGGAAATAGGASGVSAEPTQARALYGPNAHDICPPRRDEDPAEWPRVLRAPSGGELYRLRSSPAVRYMAVRAAVIFSVSPEANRAQMTAELAASPIFGEMMRSANPPGLQVAYSFREPTGWCCAMPHDGAQRALLLRHLPDARLSTISFNDFCDYFKPHRVRASVPMTSSASQQMPTHPQMPRKMRVLQWNDANLLRTYMDQLGGIDRARFICLDMEAAHTRGNQPPHPLELALYGDGGRVAYHTFVHPGRVTDPTTASALSLGMISGSHAIPFRNSTLLRTDYAAIAEELRPYFVDGAEDYIFIFKGFSAADIDAFRWVFAAAHEDEGPVPIIHAFDLRALARALLLDTEMTRPALHSVSTLDIEWAKLPGAAAALASTVEPTSGGAAAAAAADDEDAATAGNDDLASLEAQLRAAVPEQLRPGRRHPPLPTCMVPRYCSACWYHQRQEVQERAGAPHCAAFDAQLLYHRVQQLLALHRSLHAEQEQQQQQQQQQQQEETATTE